MRADLKRLKRDTDSGRVGAGLAPAVPSSGDVAGISSSSGPAATGHRQAVSTRRWLWLAGSLAVILGGLAAGWFFLRGPAQPSTEFTQKRLTFNSSDNPAYAGTVSADGKYLAYSDSAGIHVKLLSTGDERLIPRPAGVPADAAWVASSWFPNDTQLLATAVEPGGHGHQSIWTASVLAQSPRELREGAWGGELSPDGTHIAFSIDQTHDIWMMGSQGENPQKVFALGEGDFNALHWSPNGQRLAYIRNHLGGRATTLESCDLKGANRTVVVSSADRYLSDFAWLPDKRIVYSQQDSPGSHDDNLWQIAVDSDSGRPSGRPKRITQWAGSDLDGLRSSADGRRLVLQKMIYVSQVYVGKLTAGGTRMNPPRQLTNVEATEYPTAWTADSKSVLFNSNRNGTWGVFKQVVGQDTAEAMVEGLHYPASPRLSPDGAWVLYLETSDKDHSQDRLMRIPVLGGAPQFVLDTPNPYGFACARTPASLCVLLEVSQDEKQLTMTAFDPVEGRGKLLRTIAQGPHTTFHPAELSPDGTTFAISRGDEPEIHIRLLSGGSDREITVKGWPNISGLDWSPDEKGFYVGSYSPQGKALLYADLKGNAGVLWQFKGTSGVIWSFPSPDGRHLAILGSVTNSNVWMLEGFYEQ
jgi:Tol biopolymer transport system component